MGQLKGGTREEKAKDREAKGKGSGREGNGTERDGRGDEGYRREARGRCEGTTCGGNSPVCEATRSTTSCCSSSALPCPSGLCACTIMRALAQKSISSH